MGLAHYLDRGYFVVDGCDLCTLVYRAMQALYNEDEGDYNHRADWGEAALEARETIIASICCHHGHDMEADHCGMPDHDRCARCHVQAPKAGYERVPGSLPLRWRTVAASSSPPRAQGGEEA